MLLRFNHLKDVTKNDNKKFSTLFTALVCLSEIGLGSKVKVKLD